MALADCLGMTNRGGMATVLILFTVVAVVLILGAGTAAGTISDASNGSETASTAPGEAFEVSGCRTIDEPGRYVLTADIEDSRADECITIIASDVVFDGQGHTLDGREGGYHTEGIAAGYTDPVIENITIKNLVVTDWTQGVGCRKVASNVTIENVTARRNGLHADEDDDYGHGHEAYAIYVGDMTHNVTVRESLVVNNSLGILISNTTNNVIRDNVIRDNDGGVSLGSETWNNRVINNRIVDSRGAGIFVGSRSPAGAAVQTQVRGNSLRGNGRGVFVEHANTNLSIVDNTIHNTGNESIWIAVVNGNVTIANNLIRKGQGEGIILDATTNGLVKNNRIRNVAADGILLKYASTGNVLRENHIVGAQRGLHLTDDAGGTDVQGLHVEASRTQAISFDGAGNNRLVDARVRGGDGIEVKTAGNQLRNITVTDTSSYGIRLDGADHTRIETVTARNTGAHAYEAVGRSGNVTLQNLSLASGRVSLSGADAVLATVDDVPTPPAGKHTMGVAVRVQTSTGTSHRGQPAELTVYYPDGADTVTLWRWADTDGWQQFDATTAYPTRNALSAPLPTNTTFVTAPLSATPLPTPTATQTTTTPETGLPIPGFGVGGTLLALLVSAFIIAARTRR